MRHRWDRRDGRWFAAVAFAVCGAGGGACVGPTAHVITGPVPAQLAVRIEAREESAPLLVSDTATDRAATCRVRIIEGRTRRQAADTIVLEPVHLMIGTDGRDERFPLGCFTSRSLRVVVPAGTVVSRLEPPGLVRQTVGTVVLGTLFIAAVGGVILGVGWLLSLTGA